MSKSPSEYLRIADPLACFYFDRAIWRFASEVQSDLDQAEKKAKNEHQTEMRRQNVLRKWMPETMQKQFKDPAAG